MKLDAEDRRALALWGGRAVLVGMAAVTGAAALGFAVRLFGAASGLF